MITEASIRRTVAEEYHRALTFYPAEQWSTPYGGLRLSNAKRAYGSANSQGRLSISRVYIGSDDHQHLVDTVRHELAHLIAGVRAKHGPTWRAVARRLGTTASASTTAQCPEMKAAMRPPLALYAQLETGEKVLIKTCHKRSRKYLDHGPGSHTVYRIRGGEKIIGFRYTKNDN